MFDDERFLTYDSSMSDEQIIHHLREQLKVLYEDRKELHRSIGVSHTSGIVAMVRSLEAQLSALYAEKDPAKKRLDNGTE